MPEVNTLTAERQYFQPIGPNRSKAKLDLIGFQIKIAQKSVGLLRRRAAPILSVWVSEGQPVSNEAKW